MIGIQEKQDELARWQGLFRDYHKSLEQTDRPAHLKAMGVDLPTWAVDRLKAQDAKIAKLTEQIAQMRERRGVRG